MPDNPPPNPPQNENASTSGDGPCAKKAKTSPSKSSDSIARLDTARGGSRKATITLHIGDVKKFKADNVKVEGDKVTHSGIDWWITAEIVDDYLSVKLKGSHPRASEWHCKVNVNVREPLAKRSNDDGVFIVTHKTSSWGYNKWMPVETHVVTLKKVKADEFAEFLKALAPSPMPINGQTDRRRNESDLLKASKLKNESKFSKLTWIKLFREYTRFHADSSDSESDSDA